jgi:thymidine phosphorylase
MPKTSSRAITSPAGTADTMETLAPVDLDLAAMRRVVEREGGCVVWGGAVRLSPVDDMLIRVARVMDLDAEGQLIASVLSKKDCCRRHPPGARYPDRPDRQGPLRMPTVSTWARKLENVARAFGVQSRILMTDGRQPVGRGIGPALEARDILAVLDNDAQAPADLRQRALDPGRRPAGTGRRAASDGNGFALAEQTLASGAARAKFLAICQAQGGLREPPQAKKTYLIYCPSKNGPGGDFDNRRLGRVAKLAGAPGAPAAGVELHVHLGDRVEHDQPLYTIHAETAGELNYAREYAFSNGDIIALRG